MAGSLSARPGRWRSSTATGRLSGTWRDEERLGLVTAIGFSKGNVFLADAAGPLHPPL